MHRYTSHPLGYVFFLVLFSLVSSSALALPYTPPGDTLTVIMRPILNVPAIIPHGDTLEIDCAAFGGVSSWTASLIYRDLNFPLSIASVEFPSSIERYKIKAVVPAGIPEELYDLAVAASGGISDTTENAVQVIDAFESNFYFIHITDTHMVTHLYYDDPGSEYDSSELVDCREVINDINLINPAFLLITGDFINEGELEDFEYRRYFTRTQRLLTELEVPVYLQAGNHDVGGWDATPPSDGTARRDWWKFFGWPHLDDPPPGDPARTQDYSFDYGSNHFVGLEAYINYDSWRSSIYGSESFRSEQLTWLSNDLAAASGSSLQILFYHRDFQSQLNLASLGVDLALSGHIHRNEGSLTGWPLDISTDNVCDGSRAYRVVRISGSTITPSPTVHAGSSGGELTISFSSPNDGTVTNNSATIVNNHSEGFENAMVRFYMIDDGSSYSVTNGTLLQTVQTDSVVVCHVGVDVQSSSSQTVYVDAVVTGVKENVVSPVIASSCYPNPFSRTTSVSFSLSKAAPVELVIVDPEGRIINRLVKEEFSAGTYVYAWDGTDHAGRSVAPGVYLCTLDVEGRKLTQKLLVIK
jgi:3',5'-cyclic AMP phosphodiesterase CpdA